MLPIDAYVIALDCTNRWIIREGDAPFIKQLRSVYVFDRNVHHHCCELTPSYHLYHCYDELVPSERYEELAEDKQEELRDYYELSWSGYDSSQYVHVRSIERLMEQDPKCFFHHGETGVSYDDCAYDEQMEELVDHYNANWVL